MPQCEGNKECCDAHYIMPDETAVEEAATVVLWPDTIVFSGLRLVQRRSSMQQLSQLRKAQQVVELSVRWGLQVVL